jgi:serine/threonine-protein kinase
LPPENSALLLTREVEHASPVGEHAGGLPIDVLSQSISRLRVLALLYAFVFFMTQISTLLLPQQRARMLGSFVLWGPGAISIAVALFVAALIRSARIPLSVKAHIGLAFEVAASYGIAAAEFLDPSSLAVKGSWTGLSWVAVWTALFTVVVPTKPRRALAAALASVSAVPVVVGSAMAAGYASFTLTPVEFFLGLVFPYLFVVVMAYVGARVVYTLGSEVSRARELGSYRLVERLGQGGMGEVWRAEHKLLARPAAVKLIRYSADGRIGALDDARRRFEREAQVIASLRSPHTVNLFDFGVSADGAFYYVMELLDGLDAETLVRHTGPVPAERAIHLLRQVCHSLSEAESRGLVHRDIKPANIFLCRYGEDHDFVKVLDFGIVKATLAETGPALTRDLTVRGTPAFMAPEQAMGSADVDGRADIYATGCVAYWLLTGQQVFTADTPMALLLHHAQTPATPPSAMTELPIPSALDELVLCCLAKDPAARPQTARELSGRLASVDMANDWTDDRAKNWWASHYPTASSALAGDSWERIGGNLP